MNKNRTPYGLLFLYILTVLTFASGCTTSFGLGFGFGSGGSSLTLGVSTTLPKEQKTDIWAMQGKDLQMKEGERVTLTFPKDGVAQGEVWGSDPYSEVSNIGMAAVHSGLITFEEGGTVIVERTATIETFEASERNTIKTLASTKPSSAFTFIKTEP